METIKVKIKGISPILLHNPQTADSANKYQKQIKVIHAKKNKKTESDELTLRRLQWEAGLYLDEKGRICIPSDCIEGCIRDSAKKTRAGKDIVAGLFCAEMTYPLDFPDTNKTIDELYDLENQKKYVDCRLVVINKARVMGVRPIFYDWSLNFDLQYNENILNKQAIKDYLVQAGQIVGLCDYRPKFGRFTVEKFE